ncbi:MAG: glutamate-5-semialdehyde dehydrogenase [Nitrospirota bacterium]|nr:glutamate-5-semialdehyde dehydrogenase [Nitrospirota bacterium]
MIHKEVEPSLEKSDDTEQTPLDLEEGPPEENTSEETPEEEELDTATYLDRLLKKAKSASPKLGILTAAIKNRALLAMADGLEEAVEHLLEENEKDLEAFDQSEGREAMADRLKLTPERITEMATGIREIAKLRDPVGESLGMRVRPNGMKVGRVRVPIGVIGMIYESRPNVTADAAALCLKSGNVCVLRGGSEAIHSNTAIAAILSESIQKAGLPEGTITFVERTEREVVLELLKQDQYIDLIIPRGGESLMATVNEHATIPVIKHDKGVCHTYIDADAEPQMAHDISFNAKVQRASTCNAMETLLVHQQIARNVLPKLGQQLTEAKVEIRGCPKTLSFIPEAKAATDEDYGQEFLELILAVKVVKDMDEALEHIQQYGSRHTEVIVTSDYNRALRFMREVDASAVMVNASSRLNDGYQFGLGAEIGISTTRIHARGPMGLEDLTCAKYVVFGSGQIRE